MDVNNSGLNSKRYNTLAAVFKTPPPANLSWREVESLLKSLGFSMRQSRGSSVSFGIGDEVFVAHRPHGRNELLRAEVKKLRIFLQRIGIAP